MKALKQAADKAYEKTQDAAAKSKGKRAEGRAKGGNRSAGKGAAGKGLSEARSTKASTPCPFYDRGECMYPGKCGFLCPSNSQTC